MASKIYTAQEMREAADFFVRNAEGVRQKVLSNAILANIHDLIPMLRYAAEIQERCDKAVESMHTQLMHLANEGKTTVDIGRLSKYFAHLENILRGDAGNNNENK